MSTVTIPGVPQPGAHRMLWAVIAALGATTLALGAALVQVNRQSGEEIAAATPLTPVATVASVLEPELATKNEEIVAEAPVKPAPVAPKKIVKSQSASAKAHSTVAAKPPASEPWEVIDAAPPGAGVPVASSTPHKAICAVCGTVESVTPVEREAKPSGAGAVAGAVLGGLVGNQFGGGDGKALATIAGVLGGGWAGNTVEKKMKKDMVYRVEIRMEDGSVRSIEQSSPATVGARVKVEGNSISPANEPAPAA
ncbi:glycine zipper 2TM domain-containing protein [Rhodoferax saidenbachensis]|uniref:Outer membrane lipoprotein SlyB n=1 Tax=Rhodoferax saidenbachensis TaxID=1484693 RepID=A0ABU1ZN56_9BURK|nr:glycine zipper 2TM domain-containing protein [Rhodoferax saidenbachensis]MDR7306975.1 outer membrane lipoprotein SlyB [Rhodoferax saidenbachensis]